MSAEPEPGVLGALGLLAACLLLLGMSQVGWLLRGWSEVARRRWTPRLIALAVGVLGGDIVLHLVPHGFAHGASGWALAAASLSGVVAARLLDIGLRRLNRQRSSGRVALGGDASHNFADGLLLGTAFAVAPLAGLAASLAILAHELGQELGDTGILLDSGYPLAQAMRLNLLSALPVLPGALLGFSLGAVAHHAMPFLHVFVASTFAYLIAVHLLPRLHRSRRGQAGGLVLWALVGVLWTGLCNLPHSADETHGAVHAAHPRLDVAPEVDGQGTRESI